MAPLGSADRGCWRCRTRLSPSPLVNAPLQGRRYIRFPTPRHLLVPELYPTGSTGAPRRRRAWRANSFSRQRVHRRDCYDSPHPAERDARPTVQMRDDTPRAGSSMLERHSAQDATGPHAVPPFGLDHDHVSPEARANHRRNSWRAVVVANGPAPAVVLHRRHGEAVPIQPHSPYLLSACRTERHHAAVRVAGQTFPEREHSAAAVPRPSDMRSVLSCAMVPTMVRLSAMLPWR